jgi:hypothetical protein
LSKPGQLVIEYIEQAKKEVSEEKRTLVKEYDVDN